MRTSLHLPKYEPAEDLVRNSIHKQANNLHPDDVLENKLKQLDPRVLTLIHKYMEEFGELPPAAQVSETQSPSEVLSHS